MDPTGVLRGVDVSHHQPDIDVGRLPVEYVIARTAQAAGGKYGTTIDRAYAKHKANAKRAGKLFCSYLYVGMGLTAAANVALHVSVEPDRSVPVMVDWEDGSGSAAFLRSVIAEFGEAGYHVALTYAPRWYWQSQGSPSLAGLPPLVSSRYPDRVPGDFDTQYRKIPVGFWDGYGGNSVVVVQISANGRLQPYPGTDLDLDAYRGTRAQFAALLNPATPSTDGLDMTPKELEDRVVNALGRFAASDEFRWPAGGRNPADNMTQQTGSLLDVQTKLEATNGKLDALVAAVNSLAAALAPATPTP